MVAAPPVGALHRYAVGAALAGAGVVSGGDMTTEALVTKLSFLLDRGDTAEEV